MTDFETPAGLSRRSVFGLGLGALVAACSRGGGGTLNVGDQRGGLQTVLDLSGNLANLPYKIQWSAFPNAAPLLEALNAGAIDSGIGGDSAFIFSIGTGATIKAIGAQKYKGPGPVLVVRGDSPIRSINDIVGKKIATPRGSISHNFILAALEAQGKPLDAVQFAFLTPADGQAAMQGGSVDGWAIWDPAATIAEKQGARIIAAEGLVPAYAFVFARDGAIADRRDMLADLHKRLHAAWEWGVAHRPLYAARLAKDTAIAPDVWQRVLDRTQRLPAPIDDALIADQQKTADRYLRAGLIAKPIDVRSAFDKSFGA